MKTTLSLLVSIALSRAEADDVLGNSTLADDPSSPSAVPVAFPKKGPAAPSIADLLLDDNQFSFFVMTLEQTDLLDALDSRGPFTVLAPTNRAFTNLPPYVFNTLTKDTRRLRKIVLNHALGGKILTTEMSDGQQLETLLDLWLEVDDLGYAITIDDERIVESDMEARNGVLDAIDGVLLPCDDSPTWQKKFSEPQEGKDCSWVAAHRPRCDSKGVDNVRAWYACPYACDTGCFDSETWHKTDEPWKDCEWVSIKPETRCDVTYEVPGAPEGEEPEYILARQECPTACSNPGPFKERD